MKLLSIVILCVFVAAVKAADALPNKPVTPSETAETSATEKSKIPAETKPADKTPAAAQNVTTTEKPKNNGPALRGGSLNFYFGMFAIISAVTFFN